MRNRSGLGVTALLILTGLAVLPARAAGPDVIVGDLPSTDDYWHLGGRSGLAVGTTSCNKGDAVLNWIALPDNRHPVIAQNLYMLKDGRMTHIGMSWLKHGFTALQGSVCFSDCVPNASNGLGVHCSDPYGSSLNAGPNLGARKLVNPVTGYFDGATANVHTGHDHTAISHTCQVADTDLTVAGALYFVEGQYIAADDAAAGNGNNNASYRQVTIGGTSANWTFSNVGATVREQPAHMAWPGVSRFNHDSWPADGRITVLCKSTDLGGGQYRYDYAVYNMNSERAVQSFTVPVGSATITNIGFAAPLSHDEDFSNTPWPAVVTGGNLTWQCDPYATDPNANAIRWGNMYNFWFDANVAPTGSAAIVSKFKPGAGPGTFAAVITAPAPGDCNSNGIPDPQDILNGATDCNGNSVPDTCEMAGSDCNNNNILDVCELTGNDCNANGILDICELAGHDCNNNGVYDSCELAGHDCNNNGVYDTCELAGHDCNNNGVYDSCEIAGNDCDLNGVLDVCQLTGNDCDNNGVPDNCQNDCDQDGTIDACENAPDCNHNGIPDNCDVNGLVGGAQTIPSGDVNVIMPDNPTVTTHVLNSSLPGNLTDVNVKLNIRHTYDGDLEIRLIHGAGNVIICNRVGGSGDNFTNTVLDDSAATAIGSNAAPFNGTYRPSQVLTAFNGLPAAGPWTLSIADRAGGDTGTLLNWSLILTTPNLPPTSPDANTNGVPDECEACGCPGDMNNDHVLDGRDVAAYVAAMMGAYQPCADMNGNGSFSMIDTQMFIDDLMLPSPPCP